MVSFLANHAAELRDYVTCSKFTTKPPYGDIFSLKLSLPSFFFFTLVFFSSLLLWELADDKIYNLHHQTEAC